MHLNQCLLFVAGLYLTFAFDDLSFQTLASQSPEYPSSIYYDKYKASNAVDRNTTTCMRTDYIEPNSPHKSTWWKVDLGGLYNIYSIHILFKDYEGLEDRQRGRFAGFSIYVSNIGDIEGSALCYKDGPHLPPLNFTTTCSGYGRYVIFYNERKDGVVYPDGYQLTNMYTELCEVIVKGCKRSSVYGIACDIPCPVSCKNRTCHIQNGACLECEPGVYSSYCNLSCPTNCNDNTCHRQNGTCFTCKPGWTGIYCKTKCTNGWYGVNCSQQCSGRCKDSTTCNHVTGQCDRGCDSGWTGSFCIKECNDGHFGLNCGELCSGHCENNDPCDHVSGVCPGGCQDGYMDVYCNNSCKAGHYGKNCTFHCSSNCNSTCEYIDKSCINCKEGWNRHCSKAHIMLNQNVSSCNIALIVSLVINFVFISGTCLLCRGIYTKEVSISRDLLSCSKKSIYTDTNVTCKAGEYSTYQELDLSREEIQYQNTTIR